MLLPVLIATIVSSSLLLILIILLPRVKKVNKNVSVKDQIKKSGKNKVLRDLQRKIESNPNNIDILKKIGEYYYEYKDWQNVFETYLRLSKISSNAVQQVDRNLFNLRMGIASYNLKDYESAIEILKEALIVQCDNFDLLYHLGLCYYYKENYTQSAFYFKKAIFIMPEHRLVYRFLGISLCKDNKFNLSIASLKKAIEINNQDSESYYYLAIALRECGAVDQAIKIFIYLKNHPKVGYDACFELGMLHEKKREFQQAIENFIKALNIIKDNEDAQDKTIFIEYHVAKCYIALNNFSEALNYLNKIDNVIPRYKDVEYLIARYSELSKNSAVADYLYSPSRDFIVMCRKIIAYIQKNSFALKESIKVGMDYTDFLYMAENGKWEVKYIYRFYRNENILGDISIREFYSIIKENRFDQGYCITLGSFTDSTYRFAEGRTIELIEKMHLLKILKAIK